MANPWEQEYEVEQPPTNVKQAPWEAEYDTTAIENTSSMPWYQKALVGAGYGLEQTGLGIGQRIAELQGPVEGGNPLLDMIRNRVSENRQAYAPLQEESNQSTWPTSQGVGQMIGSTVPTTLIPGGAQKSVMGMIGNAALQGGAQGFVQPTVGDESPMKNAAIGAGFGGAIGGAGVGVSKALWNILPDTKGVRMTIGEIKNSPGWERVETIFEQIPFIGLKKFREKQLVEAEQAAQKTLADYIINPNAPDIKGANTQWIDKLYDDFRTAISGKSLTTDAKTSNAAASNLLDRYSPIFEALQDNKVKRILKDIAGDTTSTTQVSPILNAQGGKIVHQVPPSVSIDDLWQARKGLWNAMQKEYRQGNKEAYAVLSDMRNAITDDLNNLSDKIAPGASQMFKVANEAYKKYEVKFEMLQNAYDKATRLTGDPGKFSPKLFSNELYKIVDKTKDRKLFAPGEIETMTGVANIMDMAKRAGQFQENVPTGNRFGLPIMAEMAGIKKAAWTLPYILGIRWLTTSIPGKRLAMTAANLEPTNPNMKVVVKMFMNQVSRIAAEQATEK